MMEYIIILILSWGILGAICLLALGIKKDIQAYVERKREAERVKNNPLLDIWHWPQNRWSKVEYACPHGIGHGEDVHGCDGCCSSPSYKRAIKRSKAKRKKR